MLIILTGAQIMRYHLVTCVQTLSRINKRRKYNYSSNHGWTEKEYHGTICKRSMDALENRTSISNQSSVEDQPKMKFLSSWLSDFRDVV